VSQNFDADLTRIRLIVNGDDFGAGEEVNEAIVRAYREGVLTSCSLIVTGDAFSNAVRLAKENPGLAVGIHLVTVLGRAVLAKSEIPRLVDADGRFSHDPIAAGLKYFFSSSARQELKKELTAQFDRFKATELPLSHIDAHLHMHVHPVIFRLAVELGERYGVRRMRVPDDELVLALAYSWDRAILNRAQDWVFAPLIRRMKRHLRNRDFVCADRVYGHFQSGRMNAEYFHFVLGQLRARTNEIYFHPAYYDAAEPLSGERLQALTEFKALTHHNTSELLHRSHIELINYFQLDVPRE